MVASLPDTGARGRARNLVPEPPLQGQSNEGPEAFEGEEGGSLKHLGALLSALAAKCLGGSSLVRAPC